MVKTKDDPRDPRKRRHRHGVRKSTAEEAKAFRQVPESNVCDGGLASCTVCKGGEASLPTHCPGVKMTAEQQDDVQAGRLDFAGGEWISTEA